LGLGNEFLKGFIFGPTYDWMTFDFDRDPRRLRAASELVDVGSDLSAFAARGGKMLAYHGWQDPRLAPQWSIDYLDKVARSVGGSKRRLHGFLRLFMVPGMGHCGGGPGPNVFDRLTALENWVEGGVAPVSMVASHRNGAGAVDRTRPLCPYPLVAVYDGSGSIDDASNFSCGRGARHDDHDDD
jgi:feruloyl esterase